MSRSNRNLSGRALARQALTQVFAERFGAPRLLGHEAAVTATFALSAVGDTALCVRLNIISAAKIAETVQCVDRMLAYCLDGGLVPRALVIAEAGGLARHSDRPDLSLIEDMVERGRVKNVLWLDVSALSRSDTCARKHVAGLEEAGAKLHLLGAGMVDIAQKSAALDGMLAISAAESNAVRQKTSRALMWRAQAGQALWQPRFGFRRDPTGQWEVDPAEWPVVHAGFHRYLTTRSMKHLSRDLAERFGIELSPKTLRRVLTDQIYVDGRRVQMVAGQPFAATPVVLDDPVPLCLFNAVAAEMARRRA